MRRIVFLSVIAVASLLFFSGCEKDNGPKVETLSAEKGGLFVATLTGRVSGLENVALDFECGIEYSTETSFAEENTIRQSAYKKYSEDPYTVTITGINLGQKYYYRAYYFSQLMIYYGGVKDFTFTWDIPQMVDLGLSVKWASWNVGANNPWEYGDYYAWGETETKSSYTWTNYKFRTSGDSYDNVKFSKYNTSSSCGTVDNKTTLDPEDDVAHVKWGGSWRMPTKYEQDELRTNCTWTWTTLNGVNGYLVTSNKAGYNDRSIFLPAAGISDGTDLYSVGSQGYYWSSSLDTGYPYVAYSLYFYSDYVDWNGSNRYYGQSVRPVCP